MIVRRVRDSSRGPVFEARLDGGEVIATSVQPLAAGARALLARGFDDDRMVTMRHHDHSHDSFQPKTIAWWAQWSYTESAVQPLSRTKWQPFEARI